MNAAADLQHMAEALHLAERGLYTTDPNPRVGCVIVKQDRIIARGWHRRAGEPHAEILALQDAGEQARGATLYVTLEPCCHQGRTGPCVDALIEAGVARVVVAMTDPNPRVNGRGLNRLAAAGIQTSQEILAAQARALNPGFVSRMQKNRPYVRCKLAMSLDARTAMASGESQWITGEAARRDVHRLRARSSAIITGIGTVLADDPALTVRLDDPGDPAAGATPLRVVLDPTLRIPPNAKMLQAPGNTLLVTSSAGESAPPPTLGGAEIISLPGPDDRVDLAALMSALAEREVNEVLVESGHTLSGAFLRSGLVDELIIYMAPVLMGSGAKPLLELPQITRMNDRIPLRMEEIRAVGNDWRLTLRPQNRES
ncbi:MAG: bifunctional diaminohydroxyphosphoribosylaminopyrimidine deaminase/5-amino-6-(5-phosphoribosylamino)uracil reductase RibD [Gammaproteobacteria bacterium]|nr:MAG: bifunctional diaminohydroxyphosphoribosylaminopyrimidine deaminase/5-amino-6-(5-phosphoribosylamino)uracil reductase RibD [Gammaproteobacteria bacterium]